MKTLAVIYNHNMPEITDSLWESLKPYERKNYDLILNVPKSEWKGGLEKALEYYIEGEEYEQCSKVRDLINKL